MIKAASPGRSGFPADLKALTVLLLLLLYALTAELDRRKLATSISDMKLVISMSYGSSGETSFSKDAIKSLAKQRSDVLWVAAAGNGGDNTTNYPAGYDEVSQSLGAIAALGSVGWQQSWSTLSGRKEYYARSGSAGRATDNLSCRDGCLYCLKVQSNCSVEW